MIRDYFRDYEPWLATYVRLTRDGARLLPGHLTSFSWEPALHREIEHEFFLYSQLTWEPDLSWAEFARRYVIRSERRLDPALTAAYRLALEANAALTFWGLKPDEFGCAQRVVQMPGLLATDAVRDRVQALGAAVSGLGLDAGRRAPGPARFDLRWSLAQTAARLQAGRTLGLWH